MAGSSKGTFEDGLGRGLCPQIALELQQAGLGRAVAVERNPQVQQADSLLLTVLPKPVDQQYHRAIRVVSRVGNGQEIVENVGANAYRDRQRNQLVGIPDANNRKAVGEGLDKLAEPVRLDGQRMAALLTYPANEGGDKT